MVIIIGIHLLLISFRRDDDTVLPATSQYCATLTYMFHQNIMAHCKILLSIAAV